MLPGKPLFDVRIDIEHCPHDVYVNGGLVTRNLHANPTHVEYPINHYLRSGQNDVEVQMLKSESEPDACDVKLELRWKDESAPPDATPVRLLTLFHDAKTAPAQNPTLGSSPSGSFDANTGQAADAGQLRVGAASVTRLTGLASNIHVLSRTFEIELPFPDWAFLRSEKVTLDWQFATAEQEQHAYEQLLAAYKELHAVLAKEDVQGFLDACEERSREMDIAYYKVPGETRASLEKQLRKAMSDPEFELADLYKAPGKNWGYMVGSKGTLLALTQGTRASTIFRYQLKDGTAFSIVLPVLFRKERGRFVITR
jgi:hypothetical protein